MRKPLFLLIIFIFLYGFSEAQVEGHESALKQGNSAPASPDEIRHQFFISLNGGIGIANETANNVNGSESCLHLDLNGKYYLSKNIALMAKIDFDTPVSSSYNYGGDSYPQYMGGICLTAGPKYGNNLVSFISLVGLTQDIPGSSGSWFNGTNTGTLSGSAFYEGIEFVHLMNKCGINIGIGYSFATIQGPNNPYLYPPIDNLISLGIVQVYAGLSFPL